MNLFVTWDLPTRLFHWLLVWAVFMSWLSHEFEWFEVHLWSGYTVLVLVAFRILWGFVGSVHSRFSDFLRGPVTVWQYWRGRGQERPGHNPAGGWSVLALLALLLAQALTGLFNSDDLLYDGPLHHALDSRWTDKLGAWHEQGFWILLGLIGLHVLAILYYQLIKRRNLLGPMFSGGDAGIAPPAPWWRALVVVAVCAVALALAVYYAPEPEVYW